MNDVAVNKYLFYGGQITPRDVDLSAKMCEPGCYCIYSPVSGRFYVGSAMYCGQRRSDHFSLLRAGKHHCKPLQADYDAIGRTGFLFFILERCSMAELRGVEQVWWTKMRQSNCLYNGLRAPCATAQNQ